MGYYYGRGSSSEYYFSIFDAFTLSPLPYPVLLLLAVVMLLLGISWHNSYEEVIESAEEKMSWVPLIIPVLLLITIRWLSSIDGAGGFFFSGYGNRLSKGGGYVLPQEGSSPWGVAALVVLLLVLVSYQPESWFSL